MEQFFDDGERMMTNDLNEIEAAAVRQVVDAFATSRRSLVADVESASKAADSSRALLAECGQRCQALSRQNSDLGAEVRRLEGEILKLVESKRKELAHANDVSSRKLADLDSKRRAEIVFLRRELLAMSLFCIGLIPAVIALAVR